VPPLRGGMSRLAKSPVALNHRRPLKAVLEVACFQQSHYFYRITVDKRWILCHNILCMTKAFAYLRVSGKGQEAGDGYTRQLQSINRYAAANGIKVVRIFKERGVSGEKELTGQARLHGNAGGAPCQRCEADFD
jgi:hypothetical protein